MNEEIRLEDGGEKTIQCSDCEKPLMHYRVYAPDVPIKFSLVASCPFCGGSSVRHEWGGLSHYGPIGSDEKGLDPTLVEFEVTEDYPSRTYFVKAMVRKK